MKTIIAPTDFSAIAENACLYAAKLAAAISAELVLFHTIELPLSVAEYPVTDSYIDEDEVQKELEFLQRELKTATDNMVNIKIRNTIGSAESELKEFCRKTKPFAVVMSTHGSNLLERFFAESTTLYSAKHLRVPVIVVPHDIFFKPIKKIALASDLKHIYQMPVQEVETIVKVFNAKFEIFHVAKDQNDIDENAVTTVLLENWLEHLYPESYSVQNEDVWRGINQLVEEHVIDLVIIIPKKHGPFHKSKAKSFISHLNVPVMAIHENDQPANP